MAKLARGDKTHPSRNPAAGGSRRGPRRQVRGHHL
jgi:hypothetical protein